MPQPASRFCQMMMDLSSLPEARAVPKGGAGGGERQSWVAPLRCTFPSTPACARSAALTSRREANHVDDAVVALKALEILHLLTLAVSRGVHTPELRQRMQQGDG